MGYTYYASSPFSDFQEHKQIKVCGQLKEVFIITNERLAC